MKTAKAEKDKMRAEYSRKDFGKMVRGKYAARIREGLAQAQCGEFASDEEMEAFFACYAEPRA